MTYQNKKGGEIKLNRETDTNEHNMGELHKSVKLNSKLPKTENGTKLKNI